VRRNKPTKEGNEEQEEEQEEGGRV